MQPDHLTPPARIDDDPSGWLAETMDEARRHLRGIDDLRGALDRSLRAEPIVVMTKSEFAAAIREAESAARADERRWPSIPERVEQEADDIIHDAGLILAELALVQIAHAAHVLPRDTSSLLAWLQTIQRRADAIRALATEETRS